MPNEITTKRKHEWCKQVDKQIEWNTANEEKISRWFFKKWVFLKKKIRQKNMFFEKICWRTYDYFFYTWTLLSERLLFFETGSSAMRARVWLYEAATATAKLTITAMNKLSQYCSLSTLDCVIIWIFMFGCTALNFFEGNLWKSVVFA